MEASGDGGECEEPGGAPVKTKWKKWGSLELGEHSTCQYGRGDEGEVSLGGRERPDANLLSSVHRFGVHPNGEGSHRKVLKRRL